MSATMTVTAPPVITADNVATLFPDVDTSLARDVLPTANGGSAREGTELDGYDEEQVRLMVEVCIVLDDDDKPIGSASKKTCTFSSHSTHISEPRISSRRGRGAGVANPPSSTSPLFNSFRTIVNHRAL